jgi:glycerol kinase
VPQYVGALDQGTTSTRFLVFDEGGRIVSHHQIEHAQILPHPGWVEHDPLEIVERVHATVTGALRAVGLRGRDLAAVGITTQRETLVVWDPRTGRPWHNAIVWQDTRTADAVAALEPLRSELRERTGLPPATYFSASKLRWILDSVPGVREAARNGGAVAGTMDAWVIWNLTGGPAGGRHVTDVTSASRTQLMNLATLDWDDRLLEIFDVPRALLPAIARSSSRTAYGAMQAAGPLGAAVPITACLGDQHAALIGQACFGRGEAKNTYGTGNFLLLNTGTRAVPSTSGLLTTLGYQLDEAPRFALEGSIAVTGAAVQWLRDQLGVIHSAAEVEALAATVHDTGGAYFVPAFSGLFAPFWRADARGAIVGLSQFHSKAHLARATLEAIGFQTRDVLDAMTADTGTRLEVLRVDGGATVNDLLMQLQADIVGVPVVRPVVHETTALGAAYAAGLAVGVWKSVGELRAQWQADRTWEPHWTADHREAAYAGWRKAVGRTLDWIMPVEP